MKGKKLQEMNHILKNTSKCHLQFSRGYKSCSDNID